MEEALRRTKSGREEGREQHTITPRIAGERCLSASHPHAVLDHVVRETLVSCPETGW